MGSKFGFDKTIEAFKAAKKEAAVEIMSKTKEYFGQAFDKEQLGDEKWEEVARRTPGTAFNKNQMVSGRNKPTGKPFVVDQGDDYATRKILQGTTGDLRRKTERANSSITMDGSVSTMINPIPYASYINDGTPYMKVRPFMKQTEELTKIQLEILKNKTGRIWK
jgi:hypothetical protein